MVLTTFHTFMDHLGNPLFKIPVRIFCHLKKLWSLLAGITFIAYGIFFGIPLIVADKYLSIEDRFYFEKPKLFGAHFDR